MIYIVHQEEEMPQISEMIINHIRNQYPKREIKSQKLGKLLLLGQNNLYFVLSKDTDNKLLKSISSIRNQDQNAQIVLITQSPDYLALFRSHIAFLGVVDSSHYSPSEVTDYIDYSDQPIE